MEKLLVSVYDIKALTWSFPAQAENKAAAIRMFGDLVKDGRTLVGQHPDDFSLWIVGTFDTSTGKVQPLEKLSLAHGTDFVKKDDEHEVRN